MKPPLKVRALGLTRRETDDDENEELLKPLEWGLIARLFTYTKPFALICKPSRIGESRRDKRHATAPFHP